MSVYILMNFTTFRKKIILPPQFSIFTEERRGHYCQQHCRSCLISENLENTRRENSVCFTIPRIRNAAHIPQDSNKHKKYILAIYPYYMYCIIYATIELEY